MKPLLTIILLSFYLLSYAPNGNFNIDKIIKDIQLQELKTEVYGLVLDEIKRAEGLELKVYLCPAGHPTIGYGHALLPGETFTEITQEQADSLLIIDFEKRLDKLPKEMDWNKRLAIAKFIFNLGIGYYNKSKLKQRILEDKPIDDLIVKYCHYKKNGMYVKSDWLLEQRKFELMIYKIIC